MSFRHTQRRLPRRPRGRRHVVSGRTVEISASFITEPASSAGQSDDDAAPFDLADDGRIFDIFDDGLHELEAPDPDLPAETLEDDLTDEAEMDRVAVAPRHEVAGTRRGEWSFPERRLNVLVCAHELSPYQGSECAVAWHIVTRLASRHNVTVLCASGSHSNPNCYRDAVEDYLTKHGPIRGLSFVFVDQPPTTRFLAAVNRTVFRTRRGVGFHPLFLLGMRAWQRAAFARAASLDPERFDVVHHLTPIAFWCAGALWRLGRPYVWGPMTGVGGASVAFARWLGFGALVFEAARATFNGLQMLLSVSFKRAVREASLVYTITSDDADAIERLGKISMPMLETAATPHPAGRIRRYDRSSPLRVCWSGAHIDRKALPLLLRALGDSRAGDRVEVVVLGEGQRTAAWKRLAERLGLRNIVWRGHLPQNKALEEMRRAHVLVHTSIRDGTPHVVLEAMSLGLPVVCHDAFGMGVAVTATSGIKVPLVSPARSIEGFRAAIERFALEPTLLETLSAGALRRASELTWDAIAERIAADYERLAERRFALSSP